MKIRKTTTVMIKPLNLPLQTPKPAATKKRIKKKKASLKDEVAEKTSPNPKAEARVPGAATTNPTKSNLTRRSWKTMKNKNKDYTIENKSKVDCLYMFV